MRNKIIPRNLTARAAYDVPGNPPISRLENGVGNCYPGLEYDHRNLDRRFFPGVIFDYVSQDDAASPNAQRQGAWLRMLDTNDPELNTPPEQFAVTARALAEQLNGEDGTALGTTGAQWYISVVSQGGKTIKMESTRENATTPLDGLVVWRLIRSLRAEEVSIELRRRDDATAKAVTLKGWRRRFTDITTGVISAAYQPGELTQSLCSPWMHDFRDCGCTYWASNHPDLVLAEAPFDDTTLPSGAPDEPRRGDTPVDWLRADRTWYATSAMPPRWDRSAQMSHFEINKRWQDLAIVLEGREVGDFYVPKSRQVDNARPYATPTELRDQLVTLAGLEHLVALLYLYARYSIRPSSEIRDRLGTRNTALLEEDVDFARHILLEIAASEMQHLRWVNQILWGLYDSSLVPGWDDYDPSVLRPSLVIPAARGMADTPAQLSPLRPETLQLFIDVEEPSGSIDGRYARATATLSQSYYPRQLHDLASTIVRDGEQHYLHFRDVQQVLQAYAPDQYLRPIEPGTSSQPEVAAALQLYQNILNDLFEGYHRGDVMNMKSIADARTSMFILDEQAEALARRNIGIPFLALFGLNNAPLTR